MLKIDKEFKGLIPALTKEEFEQLEDNILEEGIRDPLVVWLEPKGEEYCPDCHEDVDVGERDGDHYECLDCGYGFVGEFIIIDGHNRYEIANKHDLDVKTVIKYFDNRDEVKQWMIVNQLGRRNLAEYVKYELLKEYEKIEKAKGKEKKIEDGKKARDLQLGVSSISDETPKLEKHDTQKIIADKLNWSTGKKGQADVIDKKAPEPIKEKLRNNEMTINQAYEVTKQIEEIKEPELKAKIIDTIKQEPKKEVKKIIQEAKKEERKETLQAKAKELPAEKFQVLYCDPPWQYSNSGLNGSAESKYPTMATEDLCNMKIKTITAENAVIFMWATNPLLEDALKLMNAWGFEYKTNMVWTKDRQNFGKLGFYIWGQHELLLIGVKGSMLPIGDKPNSIITGSNNIHSKKPETVYEIIEQMYPELKYVELFARNTPRENWIKWGNEVGKYE